MTKTNKNKKDEKISQFGKVAVVENKRTMVQILQTFGEKYIREITAAKEEALKVLKKFGVDPTEDQLRAMEDIVKGKYPRIINVEFCGWGKSVIPTFLQLFYAFLMDYDVIKELHGNRPCLVVQSAPLTSLTLCNQLSKDIEKILSIQITKEKKSIISFNDCSGKPMNKKIVEKEDEDDDIEPTDEEIEYQQQYRDFVYNGKFMEFYSDINKYTTNFCNVTTIYTCTPSLAKLHALEANDVDAFVLDEAHFNFLNGGSIDPKANKCINKVIDMLDNIQTGSAVYSFTATPSLKLGSLKSISNEKTWGVIKQYISFRDALLKGDFRVIPIKVIYDILLDIKGNKITYDKFESFGEDKKGHLSIDTLIKYNEDYHSRDLSEKNSKTLVMVESYVIDLIESFANELFALMAKNPEARDINEFKDYFNKNNKYDEIFNYINEDKIIMSTRSKVKGNGVNILSKNLEFCESYNYVTDLITFIDEQKKKESKEDYEGYKFLDHDMIMLNIFQLSTGHDINIWNNCVVMREVDNNQFIQFIFRSGRPNGGSKKFNYVYINETFISEAYYQQYMHALYRYTDMYIDNTTLGKTSKTKKGKVSEKDNDRIYKIITEMNSKLIEKYFKEVSSITLKSKALKDKIEEQFDIMKKDSKKLRDEELIHFNDVDFGESWKEQMVNNYYLEKEMYLYS